MKQSKIDLSVIYIHTGTEKDVKKSIRKNKWI